MGLIFLGKMTTHNIFNKFLSDQFLIHHHVCVLKARQWAQSIFI